MKELGELSRYSDGLRVGRPVFDSRHGKFSLLHCVQSVSGAHPASYPVATEGDFSGIKRPWREADPSPTSSVEVKNGGAVPTLLPISSCYGA
jgi:hypothetical protein